MQIPKKLILLLAISTLATGCAVKTPSVTHEDLVNRIREDGINMYKDQEKLTAALPLEEALARGLKYNLDHRVKLLEDALSLRQVELMTYDMLPRIVAAAGPGTFLTLVSATFRLNSRQNVPTSWQNDGERLYTPSFSRSVRAIGRRWAHSSLKINLPPF